MWLYTFVKTQLAIHFKEVDCFYVYYLNEADFKKSKTSFPRFFYKPGCLIQIKTIIGTTQNCLKLGKFINLWMLNIFRIEKRKCFLSILNCILKNRKLKKERAFKKNNGWNLRIQSRQIKYISNLSNIRMFWNFSFLLNTQFMWNMMAKDCQNASRRVTMLMLWPLQWHLRF